MSLSVKLERLMPQLLALTKDYQSRVEDLFRNKETQVISQSHCQRSIVTNPRSLFNLLESIPLIEAKENCIRYYELKCEVMDYLLELIIDFPLNAKFIYEEAFLIIENNQKINFVAYLIRDISEAYGKMQGRQSEDSTVFVEYINRCRKFFQMICSVCTLRTSQLKLIANSLSQFYYQEQLSSKMIGLAFRLLEAGLQQRTITPYLYFIDGSSRDSVRVLFSNNRWPFTRGLTLVLWIGALKKTDCRLFWLKTEEGNELILAIKDGKIWVQCTGKDSKNSREELCEFPQGNLTVLGIQLEPFSEGLFKSISYALHVKVNGTQYKNVASDVPKFQSSEFVVQFSLLKNFIGKLYSIIITASPQLAIFDELCKFSQYGICKETLVWQLIDRKVLRTQSILCIFNAERVFEGLLLNYVASQNHACFQGRASTVKYHKYDEKILQVFIPFLYMLALVKNRDTEWQELFDLVMQYLLSLVTREKIENQSVLFILFFLEICQYRISQSTLTLLLQSAREHPNFYMDIIVTHLDVHNLLARGLEISSVGQGSQNPVQKIILMFFLQTHWSKTWNRLQGFEGWWSPFFFKPQRDSPFGADEYQFDPKKEGRVQWSVLNFVSKDCCRCLVGPQFVIPDYGKLERWAREYVGKECFLEEFGLKLFRKKKGEVLICSKISSSGFDRIKSKLLSLTEQGDSPVKKKIQQVKQFASTCVVIDILTIIEGTVRITREGFVVFSAKHSRKKFDHMCIKGFKNDHFQYIWMEMHDIRKVYRKRFNASNNAVVIKLKDGRQVLFYFFEKNAESFLGILQSHVKVRRQALGAYLTGRSPLRWIDKYMSNYEYIQWLNQIAGRSYSDITQYPVLPWTLVASGEKLDLEHGPFRDLSKNMGLQGDQDRIRYFIKKYQENNEGELFSQYHFGTHYSSSAIIFNFLIRLRPFSIGALTLQSGRFDCADRIFYSYCGSWNNAITSPTDLRELIPELYTLPQMFINLNNYDYGRTQDKISVDNVHLPKWTGRDPYKFVSGLRRGLESRYVSQHLNGWIDLVYGFKQRGKDAIESMNIFYPLTYENCIDLDKVKQPDERESFETQIAHFGQNPAQIIGNNPHPKRLAKAKWQDKLLADGRQLTVQRCVLSKATLSEERFIFKSVFEGRNAVLGIQFISQELFFVLRKHQYAVFQILSGRNDFLSKEQEVSFELETVRTSLNYKQLGTFVPMTSIEQDAIVVGGFYNGKLQIIFLKENKYNRSFRIPMATITALAYHRAYRYLFLADSEGYMRTYKMTVNARQLQFQSHGLVKAHDSRVNDVIVNYGANLITTCSEDGSLALFNAYSLDIIRTIRHPTGLPIHLAHITTSPLYAVVFYSKENSMVYVYSINGQFLDSVCDKTGFVYNMNVLRSTDSTQTLVYLNGQRELYIWELPFLKLKRKVKVKKDEFRISCFEICSNSKIAVAGTEDGALQLIANPDSY